MRFINISFRTTILVPFGAWLPHPLRKWVPFLTNLVMSTKVCNWLENGTTFQVVTLPWTLMCLSKRWMCLWFGKLWLRFCPPLFFLLVNTPSTLPPYLLQSYKKSKDIGPNEFEIASHAQNDDQCYFFHKWTKNLQQLAQRHHVCSSSSRFNGRWNWF